MTNTGRCYIILLHALQLLIVVGKFIFGTMVEILHSSYHTIFISSDDKENISLLRG